MTEGLTFSAEEDGGGGDVEEDDGISGTDVVIHGPADGPAFLAQSSSSRSLGNEIKLLRCVFAISSWSSCSASLSRRRPNHGRDHLATVVPPPISPSSRNPHSPSDNAAVTSARVVAASSEAPESLPLTVAAIFGLKSSGTPQWWIFNYLHS
ncbi:hypothetical protein F2Q69_00035589 [Brassica cretica]|uniref:Uncharacterized protein n=1 Tax=Brassica cretica TaxID=69181 RepID=A0A8S9SRM5_BRACR|nr:hypothetical protein F2Q69_00035589 [Brassica cretica]